MKNIRKRIRKNTKKDEIIFCPVSDGNNYLIPDVAYDLTRWPEIRAKLLEWCSRGKEEGKEAFLLWVDTSDPSAGTVIADLKNMGATVDTEHTTELERRFRVYKIPIND